MQKRQSGYYTYIVTNYTRTNLYTGVTNNLAARLVEHWENRNSSKTFAGKYHCFYLVYYETYSDPLQAISREKEIKKWRREKKEALIESLNPEWNFLNSSVLGVWPPTTYKRRC